MVIASPSTAHSSKPHIITLVAHKFDLVARSFLDGGFDADFGVFALEAELLQLALDGQVFGESDLGAGLDGAFDTTYRFGGLVGRAELFRVGHHLVPVAFRL